MDLTTLNDAQRTATTAPDGAHRVIAGAGTGKTRTLVHRVAWLLDQGVPPANIVLLTFTRRAAREMLQRASRQVGAKAHGVRGGTFHSFAHRILRKHAERVGRTPQFTVLDRGDAEEMVGLVRTRLGLGGRGKRRFPQAKALLTIFSSAINTGRTLEDVVAAHYPRFRRDIHDIETVREGYNALKQHQDAVDFDDLLVLLARLLVKDPIARQEIAGGCQHVLVDEYQDVNKLQAQIACLLSVVHGNLMVVGDEAQSIYAFRGASVDNILDFDKLFPQATTTILTENYRSTAEVLHLANGVLKSFRDGIDKTLESRVGEGPKPYLVAVEDSDKQADYVVERVLSLREEGVGLTEQAVLARSGMQLHAVELALSRANVPFRKYGGLRLTEAAHVKDVLALLRVSVNPRDSLAWLRVLPWCENVGKTTAQKIADARSKGDLSPLSSMTRRKAPELDALEALVQELAPLTRDPGAALAAAIDGLRPYLIRNYDDPDDRLRELESLLSLSDRFEDVPRMVSELTMDPPSRAEATRVEDEELLTLSTIHSAKGLEWRSVVVVGMGDGAFPSGFALDDPAAIEEERRLLYVAVTRAKRHLALVQPRFISRRSGPVFSPGCTLLDDIPGLWDRMQTGWAGQDSGTPDDPTGGVAPDVEDRLARFADYFGG
jgi:DNA helicase-2/ATP-dependent DNA helicase PcrA